MNVFLQYKWVILAGLEVLAWASTFLMFYARYKLKSPFMFKVSVVLLSLTGVIPQVLLGVVNVFAYKELDLFTLIIVLLLLYGFTLGKKQVKRLDAWVQTKFEKKE
jgi:hypothetical protein